MDDLHAAAPVFEECRTERAAVAAVRRELGDGVGMPFMADVGSGKTFLLGFVDSWRTKFDPNATIPFVMLVQAVAENDSDRHAMKKFSPFTRALWKVPVVKPEMFKEHEVEIRASDLEAPAYATAKVGYRDGRMTIYAEIGGIELSLSFDDPNLWLADRSPNKPGRLDPGSSEGPVSLVR